MNILTFFKNIFSKELSINFKEERIRMFKDEFVYERKILIEKYVVRIYPDLGKITINGMDFPYIQYENKGHLIYQ